MTVRIKPVNGGDKDLDAFIQSLAAAPDELRTMSRNMAEEAVGLIKDGFRSESDPYGKVWAPKKYPDGRKVLSGVTSRLKGGWHVVQSAKSGFSVAPSVDYALPHQDPQPGPDGQLKRPKRAMVPDARGLPQSWRQAFEEVVQEVLGAHFAKVGTGSSGGGGSTGGGGSSGSFNWRSIFQRIYQRLTSS